MIRLVLVRHGQSLWNEQRRIQGHSGEGLSDLGHRQAVLTADWVAATHPAARLVTSDLQRAEETAAPIAAALGSTPVQDRALRERSFGRWEGRTADELASSDPDLHARWRRGEDVVDQVGGETGDALATRALPALRRHVSQTHEDGTVVVVTHGGVVWHGLHAMLDLPFGTLGGVGNACISEVVREDGRWFLASWNQTAHLPVELRTSFRPSETRTAATER